MKGRLKDIRTVIVALLVTAALAVGADQLYFSDLEWKFRTSRLDSRLSGLEKQAALLLEEVEREIEEAGDSSVMFRSNTGRDALDDGITILVYKNEKIAYWSNNSVAFPDTYEERFDSHKPVFLSNKWFIPVHRNFGDYEMLALIKVYRQYTIVNNLLRSGFSEQYWLPSSAVITFDKDASEFGVMGSENEFHFGLIFPEKKPNTIFIIIPVLLWFLFLFFLVRLIVLASGHYGSRAGEAVSIALAFGALTLIYATVLLTGIPPSVRSTELFSPFLWSAGRLLPSVGHAMLLALLIVSGLKLIFRSRSFNSPRDGGGYRALAAPAAFIVAGYAGFIAGEALLRDLVLNSAINFEAFKILDMSFMSLAGFITVMLLFTVPVILFLRAGRMMKEWPLKRSLLTICMASLVLPLTCLLLSHCSIQGIVYVIMLLFTVILWQRRSASDVSMIVLFSVITAIFTTSLVIRYTDIREDSNMKVMAISLANDNDMVAEGMLMDMWPSLNSDTLLKRMISIESITATDINRVFRYLEDNYFNGYWENYDLNIVICRNDSPLALPSTGSSADNCFAWFDNRIRNEGDTITGTGFWFMHNQSGRAWYFSRIFYNVSPSVTNGLFIEVVSHIEAYLAGYPELLLDGSHQRFPRLKDISYAKYAYGELVLRSGDYPFDNLLAPDLASGYEYRFTRANGNKHLYYNRDEMTLALSAEDVTFMDRVITFAYLFIIILIFSFATLIVFTRHPAELLNFGTFRRRLQLSFAAVLSVVFIIIIAGALMLSTSQFRSNHTRIIREKATSLSIELEHKLSSEQTLDGGWQTADYPNLNQLLVKFSNVFFTDINLYSPSGMLLATSRPEVFARNLQGSMIDPVAYGVLTEEGKEEYIGDETIGELRYLSAYLPFYNSENELLAYLNVPYFAMQNLLTREVSNLVVTLINFTLLFLVLMMWVAVFLSERITSPLNMLQQAMASVAYGRKNEHISYSSRDEVGELVKQYNRMTDELEESAAKLARTEREMAWREMARQIAHEIKNPLTPMKLNVQQLHKWWTDKVPDFDGKLRSFTDNQIEYIDNLSNIASAFSYFARLPGAEPAEVDVIAQLKITLGMFGTSVNATITLETGNISKAMVMADREHLNGIFSNLLKNALQAIPSDRKGVVRIVVAESGDKVQIRFIDNGTGISDELSPRMFTPNFTTKSSGMGLGLSIVKRYAETAGGAVWFDTEHDNGTTFTVELPLLYTVERDGTEGI
ncbi:MAG: HAMP domain-containing protein [Bacteroidales bacterium]|nr:HAMP domain-containing protein [Bacteroidales bacterium]